MAIKRVQDKIKNNLGVIPGNAISPGAVPGGFKRCRSEKLELLDKYCEGKQYDHLLAWDHQADESEYIPLRKRKPRINYRFAKRLINSVASKLVGRATFPKLKIEEDPETTELVRLILEQSKFKRYAVEVIKKMLAAGSGFIRYYVVDGAIKFETFKSKYCYPLFSESGELLAIEVRYVYTDSNDLDPNGKPKEKWFRMLLTQMYDVLYDNPDYERGAEPSFKEVSRVDHQLGVVQGEWFRTTEDRHSPDGYSLIEDILDFIDAINYSLSQSDQAINYAQEPQLGISGMDTDEIDSLIKSSTKAWNLGRDGKAAFIEADLGGVAKAQEIRDKMRQGIQDIARVVMLDPEKIVGHAQSAKAMEVLHGPLVDLVYELRTLVEDSMISLATKLLVTIIILQSRGQNDVVSFPKTYKPKSIAITASWPPVFPMTMLDLQQKMSVATQAANASLVSRETLTRWLARDFDIENVEEELARIAAQPVLNPFMAF